MVDVLINNFDNDIASVSNDLESNFREFDEISKSSVTSSFATTTQQRRENSSSHPSDDNLLAVDLGRIKKKGKNARRKNLLNEIRRERLARSRNNSEASLYGSARSIFSSSTRSVGSIDSVRHDTILDEIRKERAERRESRKKRR